VPITVVRRTRLPADRQTPGAARDLVRAVVIEADLPDLLDEALLLTTEIATNGVVHARTEIDLEVAADATGLTVVVTDHRPGSPARPRAPQTTDPGAPDLAEHGRGLLLVDRLATSWGTTHQGTTKGVWFRLANPAARPDGAGPHDGSGGTLTSGTDQERAGGLGVRTLDWALGPDLRLADEVGVVAVAGEILRRLCDVGAVPSARVEVDQGDGRGRQLVAGHRATQSRDPGPEAVRHRLELTRPWRGELVVEAPAHPDPYLPVLASVTAGRLALLLENDRLHRSDLRRRSWLTFLAEAGELLAQSLDVDLTLALIPSLVVPRLGRWCAVHRVDEWGELTLSAASHTDENQLPSLLEAVEGPAATAVTGMLRELGRTGLRAPLPGGLDGYALPLSARGNFLGTLCIGRHLDRRLEADEIAVAEDLTRRAALAVDNARIHAERSGIARALQHALLPPALPDVGGLEFAAEYVPTGAGIEVGGDFYDVLPMPDDRWLLAIGDVSGKGVHAATVTGVVRDVLRVLIREGKPLPDLIATLNETLIERNTGRYCTLALAVVEAERHGMRTVRLHLAGHDRPILLRAGGGAEPVGATGTAVGLLDTVSCPETVLALGPGDGLLFYTDGITERRRHGELYGPDRLQRVARRLAGLPAGIAAARLRAAVMAFSPDQPRDDIAILAVRNALVPARPGPAAAAPGPAAPDPAVFDPETLDPAAPDPAALDPAAPDPAALEAAPGGEPPGTATLTAPEDHPGG
jgi:sigma-B regulation protein RsbU (phosphoserine phosphatase)